MTAFGMSWAFAQLLTAMLGYIFPNWRHMQMAAAFVALVTAPYFWLVINNNIIIQIRSDMWHPLDLGFELFNFSMTVPVIIIVM